MTALAGVAENTLFRAEGAVHHFWVSSSRYLRSSLVVAPPHAEKVEVPLLLEFFDADGFRFNELEMRFGARGIGCFDLDPCFEGCKEESGIRHGHLRVSAPGGTRLFVRYYNADSSSLCSDPVLAAHGRSVFFPILISGERRSFLAAVNHGEEEAKLKCGFSCGKRTSKAIFVIPPRGARLACVESLFLDTSAIPESLRVQAYLCLASRESLGLQLIERLCERGEHEVFGGLC